MDDFMDLTLLNHFEDQMGCEEPEPEPESEEMGHMSPYQGNMAQFASLDELIQKMEVEFLERSLEENKD